MVKEDIVYLRHYSHMLEKLYLYVTKYNYSSNILMT